MGVEQESGLKLLLKAAGGGLVGAGALTTAVVVPYVSWQMFKDEDFLTRAYFMGEPIMSSLFWKAVSMCAFYESFERVREIYRRI